MESVQRRSFLKIARRRRRRMPRASQGLRGGAPKSQDHQSQYLRAAQPQPAVQPEQHGGDGGNRRRHYGDRRRRRARHAGTVRGHADRQESVPHRGHLAGDVHRRGSIRPAARRRTRRARSTWRCGTSKAKRSACRCMKCWEDRSAISASAMALPGCRRRPAAGRGAGRAAAAAAVGAAVAAAAAAA